MAGYIGAAGLNGPRVLECDVAQGFLLLADLTVEIADAGQAEDQVFLPILPTVFPFVLTRN